MYFTSDSQSTFDINILHFLNTILDMPLTAYFKVNVDSGPLGKEARKHMYQEFPQFFVYDQSKCQWKLHQQGAALSRMCSIKLTTGELFYPRTLLTVVKAYLRLSSAYHS